MSEQREIWWRKQEDGDGRLGEEASQTGFRGQSGDEYLTTLQR